MKATHTETEVNALRKQMREMELITQELTQNAEEEREKLQEALNRENIQVSKLKKKVHDLETENEQLQGQNANLKDCL